MELTRTKIDQMFDGVFGKHYHSPLDSNLEKWYVYPVHLGHCIVCILEVVLKKYGVLSPDYLVPVPVKTVLRNGYRIIDEYIVIDCKYDSELGLITPDGDDEYDLTPISAPVNLLNENDILIEGLRKHEIEYSKKVNHFVNELIKRLDIGVENEVIQNRYGRGSIECDPISVALYDYLIGIELASIYGIPALEIPEYADKYNLVRSWFIMNRPDIYYVLID